jgi:hypothetical protein
VTYETRELARVRNPVLLLSAIAWILLVAEPGRISTFAHCPATKAGMSWPASRQMLLAMNPPDRLAAGWVLMLVAIMSPVLSGALLLRLRGALWLEFRSSRGIARTISGELEPSSNRNLGPRCNALLDYALLT